MNQTSYAGKPIAALQTMLRTIAQTEDTIPSVQTDGVYGENTKRAVSEIQRQHGMDVTGITDFETWQVIEKQYKTARVEANAAVPLQIVIDPKQAFLPGCRNKHVLLIQAMFEALADDYQELKEVHVSGVYDEATENAVRWLQKACDQTCSGICNKQMWKMLTGLYSMKVGNGKKT